MIQNLDAIKSVNILDVVGKYVKLTKNVGLCPFHKEKSGSFHVTPAKNIFKCFGCGVGGNALDFIMLYDRVDLVEAALKVGSIGGVQVAFDEKQYDSYHEKQLTKKPLSDTLQWALALYVAALSTSAPAQQYLRDVRGFNEETIAYWGIGYAPSSFDFIASKIVGHTDPKAAKDLGLLNQKESSGKIYDALRHRVIFPITDEYGKAISYCGRYCGDAPEGTPKALKGRSSALYPAEKTLFGLFQARQTIQERKFAILAEGECDVMQLHQAGATNAVGVGKAALSLEQAKVLKRFTESVTLMVDNDNTGIEKAEGNICLLLELGFKVDIFLIPEGQGKDPDDYAKEFQIQSVL